MQLEGKHFRPANTANRTPILSPIRNRTDCQVSEAEKFAFAQGGSEHQILLSETIPCQTKGQLSFAFWLTPGKARLRVRDFSLCLDAQEICEATGVHPGCGWSTAVHSHGPRLPGEALASQKRPGAQEHEPLPGCPLCQCSIPWPSY